MGKRFELTNATHINEVTVGGNDRDFERMLDDFLERMSHVDRKLSLDTQKKILRDSTADAIKSLRAKVKTSYKKHTGYAVRSVKAKTKESRSQRGTVYTTFGYRDKNIPDIYNKNIINRDGSYRVRPKPATYIGIWGDLGTKKIRGRFVLRLEWQAHKEKIKKKLEEQILKLMDSGFLNK